MKSLTILKIGIGKTQTNKDAIPLLELKQRFLLFAE